MSYFEIGIYHTKTRENVGTLWRSAYQLGASGIFTIGQRYKHQPGDTPKTMQNIPLREFTTLEEFKKQRPIGAVLVGIEIGGTPLSHFCHPKQAIYLLGAEDHGLPQEVMDYCNCIVSLEAVSMPAYNVAVAGSIVMYHRIFLGGESYEGLDNRNNGQCRAGLRKTIAAKPVENPGCISMLPRG